MAMTMPFKLNDTLYLNQFEVGDSLKFNLTINDQNVFADDFKLLGKGTINSNQGINYSSLIRSLNGKYTSKSITHY